MSSGVMRCAIKGVEDWDEEEEVDESGRRLNVYFLGVDFDEERLCILGEKVSGDMRGVFNQPGNFKSAIL